MATFELEIAATSIHDGLPNRIHQVIDRHVAETPDRVALIDDGAAMTYRELDRAVSGDRGCACARSASAPATA